MKITIRVNGTVGELFKIFLGPHGPITVLSRDSHRWKLDLRCNEVGDFDDELPKVVSGRKVTGRVAQRQGETEYRALFTQIDVRVIRAALRSSELENGWLRLLPPVHCRRPLSLEEGTNVLSRCLS